MSSFKTEKFFDYLNVKLGDLFENNCYSANKFFDNFVSIFSEVVNLFAPKSLKIKKAQTEILAYTWPV